jgi:hypothetical protein
MSVVFYSVFKVVNAYSLAEGLWRVNQGKYNERDGGLASFGVELMVALWIITPYL